MADSSNLYTETLEYLFKKLPMYQRVGKAAFKKDLTNIRALMAHMKHPEKEFISIHIAGTNGKGSTAHLLASILQAHGVKTGLYVSPHYKDFRERIKINGELISHEEVVDFVENHKDLIEIHQPSFFEISVAMAFDHFHRNKVDMAVVETGLGGRLDSTNVLLPLMSIITNIGYDHMDMLGNTLPEIAAEKAGIIKSKTPVVIGALHPETQGVFEKMATRKKSPIFWAPKNYRVEVAASDSEYTYYDVWENKRMKYEGLKVETSGPYQTQNLATVLQAFSVLQMNWGTVRWNETQLREGLKRFKKNTYFIGRWQQLGEAPLIICDSAHNRNGFEKVLESLRSLPRKDLRIVLGLTKEKDVGTLLDGFPKEAIYYFAKADVPRGMNAKKLELSARKLGLLGKSYSSVRKAFKAAKREASAKDVIFVGGSVFVVGEVL